MSYGLQVFNDSGGKRLDEISFVHNFVANGSVATTYNGVWRSPPIYITGFTASAFEWVLLVEEETYVERFNGYFVLYSIWGGPLAYTVYRR